MINSANGGGDLPDKVDNNIFTDAKHAHRGEDDVDEESKLPSLERTCKEYVPSTKITQFASTFDPNSLFNAAAAFADAMQALEFSFARDNYKTYIKMLTEMKLNENDDEEEPI